MEWRLDLIHWIANAAGDLGTRLGENPQLSHKTADQRRGPFTTGDQSGRGKGQSESGIACRP